MHPCQYFTHLCIQQSAEAFQFLTIRYFNSFGFFGTPCILSAILFAANHITWLIWSNHHLIWLKSLATSNFIIERRDSMINLAFWLDILNLRFLLRAWPTFHFVDQYFSFLLYFFYSPMVSYSKKKRLRNKTGKFPYSIKYNMDLCPKLHSASFGNKFLCVTGL
jgi:hypothetical protein